MIKLSYLLFLITSTACAGFPPTTSKVSGDTNDVVTFKYQFPNFTGTHTGTNISLGVNSISGGGTGASTKSTAFDALSPMTTLGDIIYGGASGTGTRLGIGSSGQVLTVSGGIPAWSTPSSGGSWTSAIGTLTTRVTATPTSAGQYRTMIKDNASLNFSDTDGSGEFSNSNGAKIYVFDGSGAGTSTDPNYWEIYIGTNKKLLWEFYSTTGRGTFIQNTPYYDSGLISERGAPFTYNPTTGVAKISLMGMTSSASTSRSFLTPPGPSTGGSNSQLTMYFDIYYQ